MKKYRLFLQILSLMLVLSPSYAFAAFEAVIAISNQFNQAGECTCAGKGGKPCVDFAYGDDYDIYLTGKLNGWGYDRVTRYYRTAVKYNYWANVADDVAPYGVDSADVGLLYTHGNAGTDHSLVVMGDASQTCIMQYGEYGSNDVKWDTDLNYVIIHSCKSAERGVYTNGSYTLSSMRSPNMGLLLGFHGYGYDSSSDYNDFKGFVDGTRADGLGDDWVDEMTRTPSGSDNDTCAAAIVWAADVAQRDNIYSYAGFMDQKAAGTGVSGYYAVSGCEPAGSPAIPR